MELKWGFSSDRFEQKIERGITKDVFTGTGLGISFKTIFLNFQFGTYFYNPANVIYGASLSFMK